MALNNYKGFNLFFDVSDESLRSRNQAVVMANIFEDHQRDGKLSINGTGLLLGYFDCIAHQFRGLVNNKFQLLLKERGYVIAKH